MFNSLNTRWQIGRTLFELGELAVAQEDVAAARDERISEQGEDFAQCRLA